jgi:hypothetical protein
LCNQTGLQVQAAAYSMHPLGQLRDVLSYIRRETSAPGWLFNNPLYRLFSLILWLLAYTESTILSCVSHLAVAVHLTARKPLAERQP